jgi:hypothetical protein
MNAEDGARYVLALVNHDRAEEGLPAVEWDDTAARAAERHAADMARNGFTAHWGTDGSVPEQRYSEAGGEHLVWENAACLFDGKARELDANARYSAIDLEKVETAFMSEVPPNDGHRLNILKKWHVKLGVGLAKPAGNAPPCLAQEFVDEYGDYEALPKTARVGRSVTVAGEVREPAKFGAVGVARIDAAEPIPVEKLLQTSGYAMPSPFVLYTPPGFVTPKPVTVKGNEFTIDVRLGEKGPGRYGVSVWGRYPGDGKEMTMLSLRVVTVTE